MSLTVHDETDVSIPPSAAGAEAARELRKHMTSAYELSVPVLAGADIGASWGDLCAADLCADSQAALLSQIERSVRK